MADATRKKKGDPTQGMGEDGGEKDDERDSEEWEDGGEERTSLGSSSSNTTYTV